VKRQKHTLKDSFKKKCPKFFNPFVEGNNSEIRLNAHGLAASDSRVNEGLLKANRKSFFFKLN